MNRVGKAALGCLLFPIGLAVLALIVFAGARAVGVPDARQAQKQLHQPLEAETTEAATELARREVDEPAVEAPAGMVVVLEMEEGTFAIESGPLEDGIQVDADYDEATYTLEKHYDLDGETPVFRLDFHSKVSMLRRLAQGGHASDTDVNDILITLPEGLPIQLILRLKKAQAEINLDELAITDLVTEFRMGEYTITSKKPNPVIMQRFRGDWTMGDFTVDGVSNLRAGLVKISGHMGTARMDFRDALTRDTVLDMGWRMGEIDLRVPGDAVWDPSSHLSATLGEVSNGRSRNPSELDPETAHRLKVDASVLLGEIQIEENRPRGVILR
jgi:hypothetical protein